MRRGLSRRPVPAAPAVGVDETSFQRRHEFVTVVNDLTTSEPRVLYVADRRAGAALDGYFDAVGEAGCAEVKMVAMDRLVKTRYLWLEVVPVVWTIRGLR